MCPDSSIFCPALRTPGDVVVTASHHVAAVGWGRTLHPKVVRHHQPALLPGPGFFLSCVLWERHGRVEEFSNLSVGVGLFGGGLFCSTPRQFFFYAPKLRPKSNPGGACYGHTPESTKTPEPLRGKQKPDQDPAAGTTVKTDAGLKLTGYRGVNSLALKKKAEWEVCRATQQLVLGSPAVLLDNDDDIEQAEF